MDYYDAALAASLHNTLADVGVRIFWDKRCPNIIDKEWCDGFFNGPVKYCLFVSTHSFSRGYQQESVHQQ